MSMNVFIYHHPCADGLVSAYIAHKFDPNGLFFPFNHHPKQEEDILRKYENIGRKGGDNFYFLDCCPSPEMYDKLIESNHVIILDHHKQAIEKLHPRKFDSYGVAGETDPSGCVLAWHYFDDCDEPIPSLFRMIGDRDVGKFTEDNKLLGYAWMRRNIQDYREIDELVKQGDDLITKLIEEGKEIARELVIDPLEVMPFNLHGLEFKGLSVKDHLFVNEIASSLYGEGVDAVVMWHPMKDEESKEKFKLYFRTNKDEVNVAKFAKEHFNGGGHPKASGATVDTIVELFGQQVTFETVDE